MKGEGIGGKRYISIPGFHGYVTARLNPWRREMKRLAREEMWQKKKARQKARERGFDTVVRSTPPAIPDNGRLAQARRLDASWNSPESLEKRKRNRMETRIRGNRNLRKKLVSRFGSIPAAVSAALENGELVD